MIDTDVKKDLQKDLKRFMRLHQLRSLTEVRKIPVAELLNMPGFGYRLLIDIVLNKNSNANKCFKAAFII